MRVEIQVDPVRTVVTSAKFFDAGNQLVKSYSATAFVKLGRHWYPEHARATHRAQQIEATFTYRYRLLAKTPSRGLYNFEPHGLPFLDRLLGWRDAMGFEREFADTLESPAGR